MEVLRTASCTDDEESYLPLLLTMKNEEASAACGAQWVYYYNVERLGF